jgi:hypothetical protein
VTDARLLSNAELLLRWSASLDYNRLAFDQWLEATDFVKEEFDELSGSSCADAAGHSVRVSDRLVPSSR